MTHERTSRAGRGGWNGRDLHARESTNVCTHPASLWKASRRGMCQAPFEVGSASTDLKSSKFNIEMEKKRARERERESGVVHIIPASKCPARGSGCRGFRSRLSPPPRCAPCRSQPVVSVIVGVAASLATAVAAGAVQCTARRVCIITPTIPSCSSAALFEVSNGFTVCFSHPDPLERVSGGTGWRSRPRAMCCGSTSREGERSTYPNKESFVAIFLELRQRKM